MRFVIASALVVSAVLLGVSLALSEHSDRLAAGVVAMGSATAMFLAGVLVGAGKQ